MLMFIMASRFPARTQGMDDDGVENPAGEIEHHDCQDQQDDPAADQYPAEFLEMIEKTHFLRIVLGTLSPVQHAALSSRAASLRTVSFPSRPSIRVSLPAALLFRALSHSFRASIIPGKDPFGTRAAAAIFASA